MSFFDNLDNKIYFPENTPEVFKVKICKLLDEKDKEIKSLYNQVDALTYKVADSITYQEAEKLRTKCNIFEYAANSIVNELAKRNLKVKQVYPENSPHVYEIQIVRDKNIFQLIKFKIGKLLKKLIFFEIKIKKSD